MLGLPKLIPVARPQTGRQRVSERSSYRGLGSRKKTSELIPLCHPLPLDRVDVDLELDEGEGRINITATAKTTARTGVEMEALTAVSVAALTLYDMCKSVDRGMRIEAVRLVKKSGGRSGDINLED